MSRSLTDNEIQSIARRVAAAKGSGSLRLADVRRGRVVSNAADHEGHKQVGALLVRWFAEGPTGSFRGKPHNWCVVSRVVGKIKCQGDLRILLGKSMYDSGHRGMLSRVGVVDDRCIVRGDLTGDDYAAIGAAYRAWAGDPNYKPLVARFQEPNDGPIHEQTLDLRVLVHQAMNGFLDAIQAPGLSVATIHDAPNPAGG